MPAIDPRAYDPARAERIALDYASGEPGTSLSELARAFPETVPPPMIIRRWRSVFPAFDALMEEAERARAFALMDATLPIADDLERNAANAKNAIAARWRLAESLAPEFFGSRGGAKPGGDGDDLARLHVLTDAQLAAIARGADPSRLLQHDPAPPPLPPAVSSARANGESEARPPTSSIPLPEDPMFHVEPA